MAGTFITDSTFTIKGHGLFVRGTMAAGTVQVGALLAIPLGHGRTREERITRVEVGQAPDADGGIRHFVGLQLGALAPADVPHVRGLFSRGMALVVADPQPDPIPPAPTPGPTRATGAT